MKELNLKKTIELLNSSMEFELSGVVRYTHYSLMVTGPNRIPIVTFFQVQATDSLNSAQQIGEIITGLEGHPSLRISNMEESYTHSVRTIIEESINHEKNGLEEYRNLLDLVRNSSIYLEKFTRKMVASSEINIIELRKMLRDMT
ncbi:ferritin-like domain-containing protein [Oscillatoria acuminata]|uniref:Bacterioferritin (Cytochrome b1) n=1 Tax=Oscillatoria acuminata PCC 6304 TaxID=56110 RepID=K9TRF5_9CYAN|nr:ferritin-like domain-containing protein [Oscillatoria acuminata]AFY85140.1 bacterioferritin (cytochrome b1) [Oscillatoria acuminata PCC 6304]